MRSNVHPYRKAPSADRPWAGALGEEVIFYVALCMIGAIPLASSIARGDALGVEPTIGLLMVITGIAGLFSAWRAARNQPSR